MPDNLPPLPPLSSPRAIEDIYCELGAACMLDAYCSQATNGLNHQELYSELIKHLKDGTLFLLLGRNRKPKGYATWYEENDRIVIKRLCAVSGNASELVSTLRQQLPPGTNISCNFPESGEYN